ncbi:MAG: hypothetical protein CMJ83_00690 [Planctomycetes bacterium]|nr:hypothetical protein [Planctomycetota bacterium]
MGHVGFVVLTALSLAVGAGAQAPNQAQASLSFNGTSGPPYPISATVSTPGTVTMNISGTAIGAPFIVFAGPLNVGVYTSPAGQIADIGTPPFLDVVAIIDGTAPGFPNLLAFLGPTGTASFSFPIASGATPTLLGTFQAAVLDPTHPDGAAVSAATSLTVIPPLNYGSVAYSRGPSVSSHGALQTTAPAAATPWPGFAPSFDIEVMGLAGFQMLATGGALGSHPWWRRDPATLGAVQAMHVGTNSAFPYQRTLFGDLYCFQDTSSTPNTFGFLVASSGAVPTVLTATVLAGTGNAGGSNQVYETAIAVHGSLLLAVEDREATDPIAPGQNDRVRLFTLDGTNLTATGQPAADITPTSPTLIGVAEESLTISAGGWLFFVGSTTSASPASGLLFSAPTDGTAATQVTVPNVGSAGAPPTLIAGELRYSPDRTMVVFQGGVSATEEDLYVLRDMSGVGFSVVNLTNFASATEIEEFGDASDGLDNQAAISPANGQVAFVARQGGDDELWVVPADASGSPVHVTSATDFAADIDDVIELWWADEDNLLFFAGETTLTTDLYRYQVSLGTVENLTQTNGQSSTPFASTPPATIDPDGVWTNLDRTWLYFLRDTPSAAPQLVLNVVGVDLLLFTVKDITGSEFSTGATSPIKYPSIANMEIAYAPVGPDMSFIAEVLTGTDDDVWSFDADNGGAAVQVTAHGGTAGIEVDNLSVDAAGTTVVFSRRSGGNEAIWTATLASAASAASLIPAATNGDLVDGSIVWGTGGFFFAYGANSNSNPTDATLWWWDSGFSAALTVDVVPSSIWIFGAH